MGFFFASSCRWEPEAPDESMDPNSHEPSDNAPVPWQLKFLVFLADEVYNYFFPIMRASVHS